MDVVFRRDVGRFYFGHQSVVTIRPSPGLEVNLTNVLIDLTLSRLEILLSQTNLIVDKYIRPSFN